MERVCLHFSDLHLAAKIQVNRYQNKMDWIIKDLTDKRHIWLLFDCTIRILLTRLIPRDQLLDSSILYIQKILQLASKKFAAA